MPNKLLIADQTTGLNRPATTGMKKFLKYIDLPAPANLHTQVAAGAPLNVTTGWTAMPDPSRTVQLVIGAGGVACTATLTGTRFGVSQTEQIAISGAGTFQSVYAYDSITSLTTNVDPQGTTDVQTGSGVGLPEPFASLDRYAVDGVDTAITGSHGASGTVRINPAAAPNGSRDFGITYTPLF